MWLQPPNPEEYLKFMSVNIRLLIVDDHPVVRQGIRLALMSSPRIQIVGEGRNGREALALAQQLKPDVVLMDLDLPEMSGLMAVDLLHREQPHLRVLVFSSYSKPDYVMRIIRSGVRGFLLKEAALEEVVQAIEAIHAGASYFSPDVARATLNRVVQGVEKRDASLVCLTNRECEVLLYIAEGFSNKEIASQLGIGVRTVETHRERIMRKLDIHSIAGLTRFAISQGMVSLVSTPLSPALAQFHAA